MSYKHVNYRSATISGIIATFVMIVVFTLFGMNTLWATGTMMGAMGGGAYAVGIILHLIFGVIFALIYAAFVERWLRSLPRALAGATYSLFPFIVAVLFMMPYVRGVERMYDVDAGSYYYQEKDGECCDSCDRHKKMPYMESSSERGNGSMMVFCQPEGSSMCTTGLMLCLGEFVGRLFFGITLGLLYRPKMKK